MSFRAKPNANPVNPSPATSADTLIPKVPSAVTKTKYYKCYAACASEERSEMTIKFQLLRTFSNCTSY